MPIITYLSLGWGIQSWTIAAMVALGKLPMIDFAIHSDTGHEAQGTYQHARKWTHGWRTTASPSSPSIQRTTK